MATGAVAMRAAALSAACLALNLGLGKLSNILALPLTFDTLGTILGGALLPFWHCLVIAAATSFLGGLFIHPAFPYYVGTQIVIALLAVAAAHWRCFSKPLPAALTGFTIGLASAVVSSPVTALVFGGVTVPSLTALNVLLMASGRSLWQSVIGGAIVVESIDKTIAGLLAYLVLTRLPTHMRVPIAGEPTNSSSTGGSDRRR